MEDYSLQYILAKENKNINNIFIYSEKGLWYAYEASSFYCFSILGLVDIEFVPTENNIIRTRIDSPDQLLILNSVSLISKTEQEYIFKIKNICRGFYYWKSQMGIG